LNQFHQISVSCWTIWCGLFLVVCVGENSRLHRNGCQMWMGPSCLPSHKTTRWHQRAYWTNSITVPDCHVACGFLGTIWSICRFWLQTKIAISSP
jgi:hypothetical protein